MEDKTIDESEGQDPIKLLSITIAKRLSLLSNQLLVDGRTEDARDVAIAATLLEPANAKWRVQLGMVQSLLHNINFARSSFEIAVMLNPEHTNALYFLGIIYMSDGRLDEATELLERALSVRKRYGSDYDLPLLDGLCQTYVKAGAKTKAQELLGRYMTLYKNDEDLLHLRDRLGLGRNV
jgi:tetratricopeptide (TPR) repeat protein